MSRRFLKKQRNFRIYSGLIIMLLTIMSFQNCAPAPKSGSTEQSSSSSSSSDSSKKSNVTGSVWGASTGRGNSSSGGGGIGVGSGGNTSTTSGGGSGAGPSTNSSGSELLNFLKQPDAVNVVEKANFELKVELRGGKAPFSFQWYKNGTKIPEYATNQWYMGSAASYSAIGQYHVVVTDATGRSITSSKVAVNIIEPTTGCSQGSYFTFTNSSWDVMSPKYFTEYFDGPRGKFILHSSYDTYSIAASARYAGLSSYTVSTNVAHNGTMSMSCRTPIPRIHSVTANPGWNSEDRNNRDPYADAYNYKYTGKITFECHNQKFLFKEDTCKWEYTPPPPTQGGGSKR